MLDGAGKILQLLSFFLPLASMNTAYILLGSNEGDRLQHLSGALNLIQKEIGTISRQSAIYVTVAWGYTKQPDFLNQVICLQTVLSPYQLLKNLLHIEQELGRVRTGTKWMQRIIDLDILFYNDLAMNEQELTIPHPHIQDRKFVLVPLQEIAGTFMHPVFKKNILELTAICRDTSEVKKLTVVKQEQK
jgi:2-amino-4-hydroxy-6-hydroxymethyldihydropteridine diphosphokinase